MLRSLLLGVVIAAQVGAASAEPITGEETYDLLFRNGTLNEIDRDNALIYRRDVFNRLQPESAERDTGEIALSFDTGDGQEAPELARLAFHQDERHRGLGQFPASVGNPMIMFFYETVVRDMAESAGGSPFYIRNRVKEALIEPGEVEYGETEMDGRSVETRTIHLRPFEDDPNRDRMQGFGDLTLSVTMTEAVPGWYLSFVAEAGQGTDTVYRSALHFDRMETAR